MSNKIFAAGLAATLAIVGIGSLSTEVLVGSAAETAQTAEETTDSANARIFNSGDVIYFKKETELQRPNGDSVFLEPVELITIIGYDDENQCYRCYGTRYCTKKRGLLLYISYEDAAQAVYWFDIGEVEGDLNRDGYVDIFDLGLMKGLLISYDEEALSWRTEEKLAIADINRDGDFSVLDVVWLQKWILGYPVEHNPLK